MSDRRQRRKEQTRRALLDAAMALVADRGVYATRVEDITERADVGKGAFYNYFPSKDALVAALVAEGVDRLDQDYLSRPVAEATRIADLARLHQQFFEDHPPYMLLFHQARGLLQIRQGVAAEELRAVFRDYLLRIAGRFVPPANGESPDSPSRLGLAALVAGTIAGPNSFRIAAGLPPDGSLTTTLLAVGLPAVNQAAPKA